jgi:hypothetical protein
MTRVLSLVLVVLAAAPLFAQVVETERVLFPILTPPVHGAFGSEFHTELRIANTSEDVAVVFGLTAICPTCLLPPGSPVVINAGAEVGPGDIALNGTPGRFAFVDIDSRSELPMNLRVFDVTREAENFGTEIPIVRESDFATDRLSFVGVPTDPRFRNTLRIYAGSPVDVLVTVGDRPPVRVALSGGITIGFPPTIPPDIDLSSPAYGVFTDFPIDGGAPVRVTLEAQPGLIISLLPFETRFWAFITVTNNDTQAIATITPQP